MNLELLLEHIQNDCKFVTSKYPPKYKTKYEYLISLALPKSEKNDKPILSYINAYISESSPSKLAKYEIINNYLKLKASCNIVSKLNLLKYSIKFDFSKMSKNNLIAPDDIYYPKSSLISFIHSFNSKFCGFLVEEILNYALQEEYHETFEFNIITTDYKLDDIKFLLKVLKYEKYHDLTEHEIIKSDNFALITSYLIFKIIIASNVNLLKYIFKMIATFENDDFLIELEEYAISLKKLSMISTLRNMNFKHSVILSDTFEYENKVYTIKGEADFIQSNDSNEITILDCKCCENIKQYLNEYYYQLMYYSGMFSKSSDKSVNKIMIINLYDSNIYSWEISKSD